MKIITIALLAAGALSSLPAFANEAELLKRLEKLQQELDNVKGELKKLQTKTDVIAQQQDAAQPPAASTVAQAPATQLSGYGEINYNRYRKDTSRSQADLRRAVIGLSHHFNDRISLKSEFEFEHAVTSRDDNGEVALEQLWLNYALKDSVNVKAGLFLMPFGFLNESHEPPVYYGVERNEVETRIIPSTWREGGVGIYGSTDAGLSYDVGITTGFNAGKFDDPEEAPGAPLSGMHQELQEAKAHDLSLYTALNYRAIPGLTIGGAVVTGNTTQGNAAFKADPSQPNFAGIGGRLTLWDLHARWQPGKWDLQGMYARGTIQDADRIDQALLAFNNVSLTSRPYLPSAFYGWYVQTAYKVWERDDLSLTPFLRYERYNTQASMPAGFGADPLNDERVTTAGLSFKLHPKVVLKTDWQNYRRDNNKDRFNVGIGYMF